MTPWADSDRLGGPPITEPGQVTFYTHTLCAYAERVWLSLLEKRARGLEVSSSYSIVAMLQAPGTLTMCILQNAVFRWCKQSLICRHMQVTGY